MKLPSKILIILGLVLSSYFMILPRLQGQAATIRYQNSIRGGLAIATNGLNLNSSTTFVNTAGGLQMSSSSDLVIPPGSEIAKAILYVEGYAAPFSSFKFSYPGSGGLININNTTPGFIGAPSGGSYSQMIVDVTNMIPRLGFTSTVVAGGNPNPEGRYSVADITPYDMNNYGYGWALFVVYTNPNAAYRNVTIADQNVTYGLGSQTTLTVPNIIVPAIGPINAVVAATGSWGDPGALYRDNVRFGVTGGTLTALRDPVTAANNDILNGTIGFSVPNNVTADGVTGMANGNFVARNPYLGYGGTSGSSMYYDCDIMNASGILTTSPTPINVQVVQAGQGSDALGVGTYGISVDVAAAVLTKSLSPSAISQGGVATYTFTINNNRAGAINLTNIGFADSIPSGLMIANPNCVVVNGGTGAAPTISAVPGTNFFSVTGFNINAGQVATITLCVTNKPGRLNTDCSSNPLSFTNGFNNIRDNTNNLANGVTPQCLLVLGNPRAGFTNTTVCQGTATQFTDTSIAVSGTTITAWNWTFGTSPVQTSTVQNPSIIYPGAGTYTVKLVVTASDGNKDSTTKVITVKALPTVTLSANPAIICPGDTAQLNATGGDVYLWSPPATLSNVNIANPKAFPMAGTTYNLRVTSNVTQCFKDTTLRVNTRTLPNAVIGGTLNVCPGGSTTLTASGGSTYVWQPGGATTNSIVVSPTTATEYSLSTIDANGCKDTSKVTVTINIPPSSIIINPLDRSCTAANGSFTVSSVSGGLAPYTYSRNMGITFQPANNFTSLDSGIYTIRIRDSRGCTYDSTAQIGITQPASQLSFSTMPSGCGAPTGSITVSAVTGGLAPYQYSRDGITFQSGTTISPLGSGSYLLTVRDANGCVYDTAAVVGSSTGPNGLTPSTVPATCGAANGSITITNVSGGTAPYQYSQDGITYQVSNTFTNLPGGNITIFVQDAVSCVFSQTIALQGIAGINGFDALPADETCNLMNGSLTVFNESAGALPYTYSLDSINFQNSNVFNGLDSGSYKIIVKDNTGCTFSKFYQVAYQPPIDSITTNITAATCGGPNGSVGFIIHSGTGPFSVSIDGATATNESATFSAGNFSPGNHTVSATDANGCVFTKTFVVGNIGGATGATINTTPTACTTPTGTFTVNNLIGGTAPFTYRIAGGTYGPDSTFRNLAANTYNVNVLDANGCLFNTTATVVTVNSPSAIQTLDSNTVCSQSNGKIYIIGVTGGVAPYVYSFNGSPFRTDTAYLNLSNTLHTIIVSDANQCIFTKMVTLSDSPGPSAVVINTTPTSCNRSLGQVNLGAVTGGTQPYVYSINGGAFSTNTNYVSLAGGNYTIDVRDANACLLDTATVVQNIAGPSNLQLTSANDTCNRNSGMIRVSNIVGPATPFTYTLNTTPPISQATGVFNNVPVGNYTLTVSDVNGCVTSANRSIVPIAGPNNPAIVLTQPHCENPDGLITINTASVNSGTAPFSYVLTTIAGVPAGVQNGNVISNLSQNNYRLTISDRYNCANNQTFNLTDIPGPSAASTTIVQSTCDENNGSLELTNVQNGTPPYSYADDNINFGTNNRFENLEAGNNQDFFIKDSAGCVLTVVVNIPGAPGPNDINASLEDENCFRADGAIGNLEAQGGTGPFTFFLNSSNPVVEGASYPNLSSGNYLIEVRDANNCSFFKQFSIGFLPAPIADFNTSDLSGEEPLQVYFYNSSTGANTYSWDFGNGENTTLINPTTSYSDSGLYEVKLIVANSAGCVDSTSKFIRVKPSVGIYIPNAFTPEGDGINDGFSIVTHNIIRYEANIFNRWGELLRTLTQDDPIWDGSFQGKLAKSDVYLVKVRAVDVGGKRHEMSSHVTIAD